MTAPDTIPAGEIRVWVADLATPDGAGDQHWRALSDDERRRANAYRTAHLRRRFVAARGFLRHALADCTGVPAFGLAFEYTAAGKPFLVNNDVTFNLSHCEDLAALAIARDRAVGIDVELIRDGRDFPGLASRFFGPGEAARVCSAPADRRAAVFYFHWTCKEAWLKAHGEGLRVPLDTFQILPDSCSGTLAVQSTGGRAALRVQTLALAPDTAAALAYDGPPARITVARWA